MGQTQHFADLLRVISGNEASCQHHKVCFFLIGLSQKRVLSADHQGLPLFVDFRGISPSKNDLFPLDSIVEFLVTLSKGPDVHVADRDLGVRNLFVDEVGLFDSVHTADP